MASGSALYTFRPLAVFPSRTVRPLFRKPEMAARADDNGSANRLIEQQLCVHVGPVVEALVPPDAVPPTRAGSFQARMARKRNLNGTDKPNPFAGVGDQTLG